LVLDTGYIRLAPLEVDSGDIVFTIPRVSVLSVLREEKGGFRLIGECYVQNVMDGKMIDGINVSSLQDIVIQ
jgi:hypothetical protein